MQIIAINRSHHSVAQLSSNTVLTGNLCRLLPFFRQPQAKCMHLHSTVVADLHHLASHQRHCLPSNRACLAAVRCSFSPQPHCATGTSCSCYTHIYRCLHNHPADAQSNSADTYNVECGVHTCAECILVQRASCSWPCSASPLTIAFLYTCKWP